MSSFKTFNGYEVEDAYARKSVGELSKIAPAIGMVDGTGVTITDSADSVLIDFDVYGRSTQDGEPTPTEPITPKSVCDMGYFDGELLQGAYSSSTGELATNSTYVCSKNFMPCNVGDEIKLVYATTMRIVNFIFYDEDKAFLSSSTVGNSVSEYTATSPTNAKYFKFNISESSIAISDSKHICVTINGKYALIVDSMGKNLLVNTATTQIINGVTFTVNEDKSVTVNGTATDTCIFYINTNMNIDVGEYSLNGGASGGSISTYKMDILNSDGSIRSVDIGGGARIGVTIPFISQGVRIVVYSGITVSNLIFYPMLRKAEITDATYEPYIHSRKYIPISAPLRGIGEVKDELRLTEGNVDRHFAEVVLDGSENWNLSNDSFYILSNTLDYPQKPGGNVLCSHFTNVTSGGNWGIIIPTSKFTTVAEFKAWLSNNPITVQYELAEPTNESIEPTEIVTYDNATQISVSDDAGCKVSYYRNNEDGKKMWELDNRMVTAEDTINNLESNAVTVAGDIEDIKSSMLNPNLKALTPSDEPYTIASGTAGNVISFKDTWLSRSLNDCEYLLIEITHRNKSKQIVTIPSIMLSEGATYSFPFNDVQNTIFGAYIKIDTFKRYSIGLYGTAPSDITFMLYNYGHPISVG